jgi:excisionase family DNA binding protein
VLETARILSIGEDSVRRRIASGELKATRYGRLLRVSPAELDDYCARNASRRPAAAEVGGAV